MGLSLLVVPSAAAYLDPGSGSLVFQALVAGAMAASVSVKVFWGRIRRLLSRTQRTTDDVR
ncbi:MAG: hypothetical protein GEU81_14445 [Nitriliruptorales bacterium]|nr:hypothetical protein [Nitriliruptorales bacterium]